MFKEAKHPNTFAAIQAELDYLAASTKTAEREAHNRLRQIVANMPASQRATLRAMGAHIATVAR